MAATTYSDEALPAALRARPRPRPRARIASMIGSALDGDGALEAEAAEELAFDEARPGRPG